MLKPLLVFFTLLLFSCTPTEKETTKFHQLNNATQEVRLLGADFISTGLYERDLAISPDGKRMVYTLGDYKQTKRCLVMIEKLENGWGNKTILPFSGQYQDIEPFFTVDGKRLYFASNRPIFDDTTRSDYNLWYVDITANGWGEPTSLGEHINTPKDEFYPSLSQNGNLYFTATRTDGIGREDIFRSQNDNGNFLDPIPLDTMVNSGLYEFNAYINPTEDLLVFSIFGRRDDFGGGDLYYSQKDEQGNWTKAKNMGEKVNTDKLDYCPFIDTKTGTFYFTSEKLTSPKIPQKINTLNDFIKQANRPVNGLGNIYCINVNAVL